MIEMHYAGQSFELDMDQVEEVHRAVHTAVRAGEPAWHSLTLADGSELELLLGPGIPVLFVDRAG